MAISRIGSAIVIAVFAALHLWREAWLVFFVAAIVSLAEDGIARFFLKNPSRRWAKIGDLCLGLGCWTGLTLGGALSGWFLLTTIVAGIILQLFCDTFSWQGLLEFAETGGAIITSVFGWRLFNMGYGSKLSVTAIAVIAFVIFLSARFWLRQRPRLSRSMHLPATHRRMPGATAPPTQVLYAR
jgi:hypothetical protein